MIQTDEARGRTTFSRSRLALYVFFLVGFGVPWTTAITAGLKGISSPGMRLVFMLGMTFCSIAGVLATYVEEGGSGLRSLARRCADYRVPIIWWIYALFLPLGVHVVATLAYAAAHHRVVSPRPMNLIHQWWLFYVLVFGLLQGPLGEELGWRGYLLPRLLRRYRPLSASILVGVIWAAWHTDVFFHSVSADALYTATAVALSILMTVMFLHTRGSVLLAIAMHGGTGKEIAQAVFPQADQPPDWLRALVGIATALIIVAITRGKLEFSAPPEKVALRYPES